MHSGGSAAPCVTRCRCRALKDLRCTALYTLLSLGGTPSIESGARVCTGVALSRNALSARSLWQSRRRVGGDAARAVDSGLEIDYAGLVTCPRSWAIWPALLGLKLTAACGGGQPAPTDADLAQAKSRASLGASVFEQKCASCHGPRGEGLVSAPPVIGATALPRYPREQAGVQLYQNPQEMQHQAQLRVPGAASRPTFVSAADLHAYLTQHMTELKGPSDEPLRDEDSWAVITFVLIANGSTVPEGDISAANASSVLIRPD